VNATRTVLADRVPDQRTLLRLALARDGGFDVVAETADGNEAVELVQRCEADLLLLDVDLVAVDGLAVAAAVRDARPECIPVFVSSLPAAELGVARDRGAVGLVARATPATALAAEIRAVAAAVAAVGAGTSAALMHVGSDKLAPRAARRFVNDVLTERGFDDVLDTVELLVTEVVTNAVVHARSEADVVVRLLPGAVRVEVRDGDDSFPVRRSSRLDQPGGRGFELVEQLSRSWGIDMLDVGKRVWFEVPAG
jgi:DNA-binding NarL/FixJ family response regulator